MKDEPNEYGERQTAQRRDAALRRALNTPPKPHKLPAKKKKARKKPAK